MKRRLLFLSPFLIAMLLTGCTQSGSGAMPDQSAAQGDSQQSVSQLPAKANAPESPVSGKKATHYPLTVKDATGKEFTFAKAPERIVSTSPAETEILFALGLNDQVVAVSDYDDYPEEAKAKPKIGGVINPNEEAIIGQNPDWVITGISMQTQVVDKLRSQHIPLFKFEPKAVEDIIQDILQIGLITDRQEQAEALVAQMKEELKQVADAVKSVKPEERKKVYIEFSPGWTVGKGEFMDELITLAGGVNIAADTEGWHQISEEKVVMANPDVILYTQGVKDENTGETLDQLIKERSGWEKITAIKEDRVIGLEQNLLSRPGPRITKGLVEVAKALYPNRVK